MPLPFDMLMVMLFLAYYVEIPATDMPPPAASLAVVVAHCAVMAAASAVINRLALRSLRKGGLPPSTRRRLTFQAEFGMRVFLVFLYGSALFRSAFPWVAPAALGLRATPDAFFVQLFGLIPYVALFFCAWLPMFGLHRETNAGKWTRVSFIVHKARYNLYMLLAWIPFALLSDWLDEFMILLPFLFLLAAWAFPAVLARAWGCKPMPEGEVLDSVHRLENMAGVRFSRVYLWEPGGGGVQNAAAVGVFPPFRYLFLTPALIRGMNREELEAVVLHELGHARKKHLLFYLFTSLAGINAAVLFGALLPLGGSSERFIATAVLILAYFRLAFGWLSRNMERQADLFALEKTGTARGLANALEKLGLAAGNIRLADSWHHLGIAQRVDFLRRAERDPELLRHHNAGVARIMLCGYLLSAAALGSLGWLAYSEYMRFPGASPSPVHREEDGDVAHWRRVMLLMPEDARAPLELAYRLASIPERREEAEALAEKAGRLAGGGEVAAAAAKLLRELNGGGADW